MAGSTPTPTNSSTDSSKPTATFKTKTPNASPNPAATNSAATSPAAAAPPPMAAGSSAYSRAPLPAGALQAVLRVVRELKALGLLAGFEITATERSAGKACALFDRVLAAVHREDFGASLASACRPMPPAVGNGRPVDLLRLYLAVCARGGYDAVESWGAVAKAIGFEPAMAAALKLVFYKYLGALEQYVDKPVEEAVERNGIDDLRLGVNKDRFLSPVKDGRCSVEGPVAADAGSLHLKRKREMAVGLPNAARSPKDVAMRKSNRDGYNFSPARSLKASSQSGLQGKEKAQSKWGQILCKQSGSSPTPKETVHSGWGCLLVAGESGDEEMSDAAIKPCGQAEVPVWTGKHSMPYNDPDVLKWLGTPFWPPEVTLSVDCGTIGKGRPDDCRCQFPRSIACVRFHSAEEKINIKRELGSSFYAMRFHHMGEDVALTWTKDEEQKFSSIIQRNLPSSDKNIWDKLYPSFPHKGRIDLVSYYYNVFQLRRRAYQNRLTPADVDSDDDSIEPDFLSYSLGQGADRRASSSAVRTSIQKMH